MTIGFNSALDLSQIGVFHEFSPAAQVKARQRGLRRKFNCH